MNKVELPQQILLEWIEHCRFFISDVVPQVHNTAQLRALYYSCASSSYITLPLLFDESVFNNYPKAVDANIACLISRNPLVTVELIKDNEHIDWDFDHIIRNHNISLEDVRNLRGGSKKYYAYSGNPHLHLQTILKNPGVTWDWSAVGRNPNITVRDIRAHTDLPWNYFCLSQSANIDMQLILDFPDKPWDWPSLSHNPAITMNDILCYPRLRWCYPQISHNPNLSLILIKLRINRFVGIGTWNAISCNPGITLVEILAHPELPWQWQFVSKNPNLTLDVVLAYPDKDWSWRFISEHANITAEDLLNHPELPWVWRYASYNPNVTMEVVRRYHDKPWAWIVDAYGAHLVHWYDGDWYVQRMCAIYSLLNMHEEDYERGASCLDYENAVDVVLQNECYIHEIVEYI